MRILVIAEHSENQIVTSTLSVVSAAQQIGASVDMLLYGENLHLIADKAAQIVGIEKLLLASSASLKYLQGDSLAELLKPIAHDYTHILMAASSVGKDTMPYAAASFDTQQISEITQILSSNLFVRPIYAGNAYETVCSHEKLNFITVRSTNFAKALSVGGAAEIINLACEISSKIIVENMALSGGERPDLGSARIVVSGGRGVGSKENFEMIEKLADKIGAAIGASRAAVDAGYVPNDYQVGQTGKIVAPDLYIAVGISGAIQHLAGMKDSKVIVAINKDENAPIFAVADYGIVGDLFQIIPELIAKL
jgi:electron transfer flavoprotein alpha subunit